MCTRLITQSYYIPCNELYLETRELLRMRINSTVARHTGAVDVSAWVDERIHVSGSESSSLRVAQERNFGIGIYERGTVVACTANTQS